VVLLNCRRGTSFTLELRGLEREIRTIGIARGEVWGLGPQREWEKFAQPF